MQFYREFWLLFSSEWKQSFSKSTSVFSILLYLTSISYLVYFLMNIQGALVQLEVKYWNILFWVVILFTIISQIFINFSKDSSARYLYYFLLFRPESFILSKIAFHTSYGIFFSLFTFLFFNLWLGNPIENLNIFMLTITLSSTGFSIIYTLTTAISIATQKSTLLSSILGFPLSLPIIIYTSKLCRESFSQSPSDNLFQTFGILLGFNLLLIIMSLILFPYIWKE